MRQFVRAFAGLMLVASAGACANPEASPSASRPILRISLGWAVSDPNGPSGSRRLAALLALPQFSMQASTFGSFEQRLVALQEGSLDATTAVDDVAYQAFYGRLADGSRRLDKIRGIAVLNRAFVHFLAAPNPAPSGHPGGVRAVLGSPVGNNSAFGEKLLRSTGIPESDIRGEFLPYEVAADRLVSGNLDVAVMTGMLPLEPVTAALRGGARLRAITDTEADRLRVYYPLLKAALIPRNTYPAQPTAVRTVSVALLLVCRADLDTELVYELTRAYFEDLPENVTKQTDPQRAPATVIPLHPGAARDDRERELRR